MAKCDLNSWVWITDAEEVYLPAKVLKPFVPGEPTTVETEDGEEHRLDGKLSADTLPCNEEALNSKIDDLIAISDLNEMSFAADRKRPTATRALTFGHFCERRA